MGGPQSRSGRGGEEKNSQPLPGIEPSEVSRLLALYVHNILKSFTALHYKRLIYITVKILVKTVTKGTAYATHCALFTMGTRGSFPGNKVAGA
jgi:hypothetical protein